VAVAAFCGALAYYLAARGWQLRRDMPGFALGQDIDLRDLRTLGRLETGILKALVALFLVALAAEFWLGRYQLLFTDHGNLMVGIDYVQQSIGLPLQTLKAGAALLAALLVLAGRRKIAIACAVVLVFDWVLPPLVSGLYVRPNELALEKPFLVRHIEATRAAYGLDHRARITEFAAHKDGAINFTANQALLANVRLWDWRAFHDTLSQSQPLRPYTYADTDVDRYRIDGQLRQTLLAPRELDLNRARRDGVFERRSAHQIDGPIVRALHRRQPAADAIRKHSRAGRRHRDFVDGAERRALRCEQIVNRVFVLDGLRRLRERRCDEGERDHDRRDS
jgi:hypothetical protein